MCKSSQFWGVVFNVRSSQKPIAKLRKHDMLSSDARFDQFLNNSESNHDQKTSWVYIQCKCSKIKCVVYMIKSGPHNLNANLQVSHTLTGVPDCNEFYLSQRFLNNSTTVQVLTNQVCCLQGQVLTNIARCKLFKHDMVSSIPCFGPVFQLMS